VVEDNENYGTDVLQYKRVWLDYESVVVVAQSVATPGVTPAASQLWQEDKGSFARVRRLNFTMSKAMASGSLEVIPQVVGASDNTRVTMKLRQLEVQHPRYPWAKEWRSPTDEVEGCGYRTFEVVAEDLFEGLVEMEILITGDEHAELGTVLVASRVGLADAEMLLLDSILKAHRNFFLDPENMVHGLPMNAIKPTDMGKFAWSNPTEWGFALTALATMGQLEWVSVPEAVAQIAIGLRQLDSWQHHPTQFQKGMFFPYYALRRNDEAFSNYSKIYEHPRHVDYLLLPCGDNALMLSSLNVVKGWLRTVEFHYEAELAENITSKLNFSECMHRKTCPKDAEENFPTDVRPWAVAMTVDAKTEELFPYDWNVWADEGGVVGFAAKLTNSMSDDQFHSMVEAQHMYSPCQTWQNITVANTAYFNSVFTLPTRSFVGYGSMFSSPTYHEFFVRTVVPTFRAHQATKKMIGDDFYGPSDAMSQGVGSVAFFPPNTQYDPCMPDGSLDTSNRCTWCDKKQYFDYGDDHHFQIPHGITAAFLTVAAMETSQLQAWVDDLKLLITDASGVYNKTYGLEVIGPSKRTPLDDPELFRRTAPDSIIFRGTGYYESLSHSYTYLSIYEGISAARRRLEILKDEGAELRGPEPPARYRPLSDFLDAVPGQRQRINELLEMVKPHENGKACQASAYGPSPRHDL
jgi:hypothetical protein